MAAPLNANLSSFLQELSDIRSEIKDVFGVAKQNSNTSRAYDKKEALNIRIKVGWY